jgi:hypothetical protein
VPFIYVGQSVRVRLSEKIVEVFNDDGQTLAAHSRLHGTGKFSTFDAHYPEHKLSVARFEIRYGKEQAKKLGPNVEKLIEQLVPTEYPLRLLRHA